MNETVGQRERKTQNRSIKLFQDQLDYQYLGNWDERPGNANIEKDLLIKHLIRNGYSPDLINRALDKLISAANNYEKGLYHKNKEVYTLLRFGAPVKVSASEMNETVHFINWSDPLANDFAIAEEVTVSGQRDKRPDIVLYVNGIALAVLELKRSIADIGLGIRQAIVNQKKEFIESFFTTVQFVFAGNDTQGLRYGTILTPEKYFLSWKEDEYDNTGYKLDKYLAKVCDKKRFLEIIYNFIVFD